MDRGHGRIGPGGQYNEVLDVYKRQADRDGRFERYEDDGISMDYEKGGCLKTSITMTAGERTVLDFHQEGHYETAVKTLYLDMIHREKAPYWVKACLLYTSRCV